MSTIFVTMKEGIEEGMGRPIKAYAARKDAELAVEASNRIKEEFRDAIIAHGGLKVSASKFIESKGFRVMKESDLDSIEVDEFFKSEEGRDLLERMHDANEDTYVEIDFDLSSASFFLENGLGIDVEKDNPTFEPPICRRLPKAAELLNNKGPKTKLKDDAIILICRRLPKSAELLNNKGPKTKLKLEEMTKNEKRAIAMIPDDAIILGKVNGCPPVSECIAETCEDSGEHPCVTCIRKYCLETVANQQPSDIKSLIKQQSDASIRGFKRVHEKYHGCKEALKQFNIAAEGLRECVENRSKK